MNSLCIPSVAGRPRQNQPVRAGLSGCGWRREAAVIAIRSWPLEFPPTSTPSPPWSRAGAKCVLRCTRARPVGSRDRHDHQPPVCKDVLGTAGSRRRQSAVFPEHLLGRADPVAITAMKAASWLPPTLNGIPAPGLARASRISPPNRPAVPIPPTWAAAASAPGGSVRIALPHYTDADWDASPARHVFATGRGSPDPRLRPRHRRADPRRRQARPQLLALLPASGGSA
jgi:hypothetical protein